MLKTSPEVTTIIGTAGYCAAIEALVNCRTLLLAAGLTLFLSGCKDSAIIQKEEVKSPDGYWTVKMEMEQFGGPGNAGLSTRVYLVRTKGPDDPIEVLSFSEPTVDAGQVQMNWISSRHLEVRHRPDAEVDFQAVKAAGVEISLH